MRRALFTALWWLCPGMAFAESVSVVVMDAKAMPEEMSRRVVRMTDVVLRELSSLTVKTLPKGVPAQRKGCAADSACLSSMATAAGTDLVILMALSRSGDRLFLDAFFVDVTGRKAVHRQIPEGKYDEPESSAKALVDAMLPPFARKGWGGVTLEVESGAQVRIDGTRFAVTPQEPLLALTAGSHDVDILYADGRALMQRIKVEEGARTKLSVPRAAMLPHAGEVSSGHDDTLRFTSYGIFAAGALTVASSFIVGAMARSTARDVTPCVAGQACTP
ncbi:MAG: hypothetical protein ACT4TC_12820, partial [Myxococcaceae bacterium]